MSDSPVTLSSLVSYVLTLHPSGTVLEHLADAAVVAAQLDEQSDALLDHFVHEAREAGVPWSQIGGMMGVSKQAAQQRFKVRDLLPEGQALFSRFPPRARNVLRAAADHASAGASGSQDPIAVGAVDLVAGLLTEPDAVACQILARLGADAAAVLSAVGTVAAQPAPATTPELLADLSFDAGGRAALESALRAALRLGHNYIGTEHILLGLVKAGGPVADALTGVGVEPEAVERELAQILAEYTKKP